MSRMKSDMHDESWMSLTFLSSSARSLIALRSSSEKPSVLITVPCPVAIGDYVLTTLTLPREPALLES